MADTLNDAEKEALALLCAEAEAACEQYQYGCVRCDAARLMRQFLNRASLPEAPADKPAEAETLLPHAYLFAKCAMVVPLLQEARDAVTALTEGQRQMHGISKTLADRMDIAGTYSLDDWQAAIDADLSKSEGTP